MRLPEEICKPDPLVLIVPLESMYTRRTPLMAKSIVLVVLEYIPVLDPPATKDKVGADTLPLASVSTPALPTLKR
jgi:hypothetical protein